MAAHKTITCISDLLGVATHEEVLAYFRKNKRKITSRSIPKLLEKLRRSLEEEDNNTRWGAYHSYVHFYEEYKNLLKDSNIGRHVNWCIMELFPDVTCNCHYLVFIWPSELIKEIIDAYYGVIEK